MTATTGPLRVDFHLGQERARTVHRPFFTAAILSVLTVGAGWGVLILWRIGFAERFTGVSSFGYQALPRLMRTDLVAPRLAMAVLAATLAGLLLATSGMGATGLWHTWTTMTAGTRPLPGPDHRSGRFVRAAYGWLALSRTGPAAARVRM